MRDHGILKPLPLACKPRLQQESWARAEEPWLRQAGWINVAAKVDNREFYFELSLETPILAGDCLDPWLSTWTRLLNNDNLRCAQRTLSFFKVSSAGGPRTW